MLEGAGPSLESAAAGGAGRSGSGPRLVYRGGSDSIDNLTPRPGIDTTGLSTFDTLEAAVLPGQKAQVIDTSRFTTLRAVPDPPPEGHVSITPGSARAIADWASQRGTGVEHALTREVRGAIVGQMRRPRQQ